MAIDTAQKRFSMLNMFSAGPGVHLLFQPDSSVDLDDRQSLLDCYSGIAFGPSALAADPDLSVTGVVMNLLSLRGNVMNQLNVAGRVPDGG
jgi:hypothetical protein